VKFEFEFNVIAAGNIYLIPRFVRCPLCNHEIPVGEILDEGNGELLHTVIDRGGCGLPFPLIEVMRYFGVIKNVGG